LFNEVTKNNVIILTVSLMTRHVHDITHTHTLTRTHTHTLKLTHSHAHTHMHTHRSYGKMCKCKNISEKQGRGKLIRANVQMSLLGQEGEVSFEK